MKIFLVGVSCVGKMTIGRLLADRLEYQFIDFDDEIERYFVMPISRIKSRFFSVSAFQDGQYHEKAEINHFLHEKMHGVKKSLIYSGLPERHILFNTAESTCI